MTNMQKKIQKAMDLLDNEFVERVIPLYFPDSYSQESFDASRLEDNEYVIDKDTDGAGQPVVFMTYKPTAKQMAVFMQHLESSYEQVVRPFEEMANRMGWNAEILTDETTVTFQITVY